MARNEQADRSRDIGDHRMRPAGGVAGGAALCKVLAVLHAAHLGVALPGAGGAGGDEPMLGADCLVIRLHRLRVALDLVDAMVAAADDNYTDAEVATIERSACPTCGSRRSSSPSSPSATTILRGPS